VTTLVVLSSVAACAGGSGKGAETSAAKPEGRLPSGISTPSKLWTEADLNSAALTVEDLDGYDVAPMEAEAGAGAFRATVDPAMCEPIGHALGPNGSAYAAAARIVRLIFPEGDGAGATMALASYSAEDARNVVQEFRKATERCAAYKDLVSSFRYEDVEVQSDPGYGEESVSVRLTQIADYDANGEPVKIPFAIVAVRQGATVAMFSTFNRRGGSQEGMPASVPAVLVRAQLNKMGELDASASRR